MYQPNDPNRPQPGQPYPQQPPIYPEVKPLPKGWQQPITPQPLNQQQPFYQQQPPQPQYNPNGVYGNAPVAKRPWPWWATALLAIVVFVVVIAVVANANKTSTNANQQQVVATAGPTQRVAPASDTTVKIGRVGETIALNGYTLTVNKVEKSDNFDTSNTIGKAKDGNIMLAVDITIGSNKTKGISANGLFASVKDSQGFKYDFAVFGQKEPRIAGTNDIPAGDKVRGWITFEVPKTATGLILEYGQLFESEKIRVAIS
jgi:hypothetical protein